jgi:hypothetical protein
MLDENIRLIVRAHVPLPPDPHGSHAMLVICPKLGWTSPNSTFPAEHDPPSRTGHLKPYQVIGSAWYLRNPGMARVEDITSPGPTQEFAEAE